MIFYFTGTGNSQYAAQRLASEDERLVSVVECLRKDNYHFDIAENESVGLVFPVYFGGLPVRAPGPCSVTVWAKPVSRSTPLTR